MVFLFFCVFELVLVLWLCSIPAIEKTCKITEIKVEQDPIGFPFFDVYLSVSLLCDDTDISHILHKCIKDWKFKAYSKKNKDDLDIVLSHFAKGTTHACHTAGLMFPETWYKFDELDVYYREGWSETRWALSSVLSLGCVILVVGWLRLMTIEDEYENGRRMRWR